MKKLTLAAAVAVVLMLPCMGWGASATATASITIEQITLALTKSTDLEFGTIIPSAATSVVTVSAAGVRSNDANSTLVSGGTVGSAAFAITGHPNVAYSVTLPESPVTIQDSGETHSMTVDTFTSATASTTATVGENGTDTLYVGASLNVGATQARGSYTGTFDVTINYQ